MASVKAMFKPLLLIGACGIACSMPFMAGAIGVGIAGFAGFSLLGFGTSALGIASLLAAAVFFARKWRRSKDKEPKNENRCGC